MRILNKTVRNEIQSRLEGQRERKGTQKRASNLLQAFCFFAFLGLCVGCGEYTKHAQHLPKWVRVLKLNK